MRLLGTLLALGLITTVFAYQQDSPSKEKDCQSCEKGCEKKSGCDKTKDCDKSKGCGDKAKAGCDKSKGCGDKAKAGCDKSKGCGDKAKAKNGCGDAKCNIHGSTPTTWDLGDGKGKIAWLDNLAKGLKIAAEQDKAVVVYFGADWCRPSRQMKRTTLSDSVVAKFQNEQFVNVDVDTDKNPELMRKYRVATIPAVLVMTAAEERLWYRETPLEPRPFIASLEKAVHNMTVLGTYKQLLSESPEDPWANYDLAVLLNSFGSFGKAADAFEKAAGLFKTKGGMKETELGELLVKLGDARIDARAPAADLNRAADLLKDHGLADNEIFLRGVAAFMGGDADAALKTFEKLAEAHPDSDKSGDAVVWSGYILLNAKKDKKAAAAVLCGFLEEYPNSPHAGYVKTLLQQCGSKGCGTGAGSK